MLASAHMDKSRYVGLVQLAHYDRAGRRVGNLTPLLPNLVTFQGMEVLSRLVAGQDEYRVAGVYFEYENNAGSPTIPTFDRETTIDDFQSLVAPQDYVRSELAAVPTIGTGDSTSSGNPYINNRAQFFGLATVDEGENGEPFSAAANSKIVSVGLVAMPVLADPTRDLLYARFAPASEFTVESGRNPGITWTTEFL